jgi:hypothetical protein
MKQTTYSLIESILNHDESILEAEKERILAVCREAEPSPKNEFPPGAVKVGDFARKEGVSPKTVYRALKRLEIPPHYFDFRGRLLPEALHELRKMRR